MEFFKIRRTIPFMRYALVFNIISVVTFLAAVFFLAHRGLNFSIEFTGGTLIEVAYKQAADVDAVRRTLDDAGYKAEVQNFGSSRDVLIRMHLEKNQSTSDLSQKVGEVLKKQDPGAEIRRVEFVGPQVGRELAENGALALLVTAAGIVLYLWLRFEWRFGLAAVLATLHDIVATIGFIALMRMEVSLVVVAAVLSMVGYSLNDTIIIFDRVRENLHKYKRSDLYQILNRSVNETLPRSILTHGTTLATLGSLAIFGGDVIRPFAQVMFFGVFTGTFSSIFIAPPVLLYIERRWPGEDVKGTRSIASEPAR